MKETAMYEELRYDIRILIIHPILTSEEISDELGLTPRMNKTVGQPRQTPHGDALPGVWPDTRWSVWEVINGRRFFFRRLDALLDRFAQHRAFFRRISETGGSTCFIIELPGQENIGDVLSTKTIAKLADIKASLGVEVYPHMKPKPDERIWAGLPGPDPEPDPYA